MLSHLADMFIVVGGILVLAYAIARAVIAVIDAIIAYNNDDKEDGE